MPPAPYAASSPGAESHRGAEPRGGPVAFAFVAAAAALVLAASGCGFGSGEDVGEAELLVTRDFGAEVLLESAVPDLTESDTVMRVLDRSAEVETRFGGGFVHSIDGMAGGDGSRDWLYFVNGREADRGATEYELDGGERIWWDYRDWSQALSVPAVVGQFPEPFASRCDGDCAGTRVECHRGGEACSAVTGALEDAGVEPQAGGEGAIRVLVGPWRAVSADPVAEGVGNGPGVSGVYARFDPLGSGSGAAVRSGRGPDAGSRLVGLGVDGDVARRFGPGTGLIAATGRQGKAPVWLVTGPTQGAVAAAAGALESDALEHLYAAAVEPDGEVTPLPVR